DGESAGVHNFEITTATPPDGTITSTRKLVTPSEIYNRAAAGSVLIENINSKGVRRNVGTGFFIGPHKLLTAFKVIDDAMELRIVGSGRKTIETTEVLSCNRRQDWVILKVDLDNVTTLQPAAPDSAAVGDRSYFLDAPTEGNRVLVETSVIGNQDLGPAGSRLNIGDTANRRAVGSPLLNEYGEVIGLLGGSLLPGAAFLEDPGFGARNNFLGTPSRGSLAVPIKLVVESSSTATTIE